MTLHSPAPEDNAADQLSFGRTSSFANRTAVFGGTFDPIHNGHLFVAGEVVRRRVASEVLFVPSGRPPHKAEGPVASAEQRLAMVNAALEGSGEFSVSDVEIARDNGYSYTYDTMQLLTRVFPERHLVFLLGMDSLAHLHTWHRASELVSQFDLVTYPRLGAGPPAFTRLGDQFGNRNAARLLNCVLRCGTVPISSSRVRQCSLSLQSLAGLVPIPVVDYIRNNRLYRET